MSNSKPKILFVYDHQYPKLRMDGLYMALEILENDFEIEKINIHNSADRPDTFGYPFVLGWGGFNSKVDNWLQSISNKKGLCIAGNAFPPTGANTYDVLFYETKWYRPQINFHKNIVQAFGVNTNIYFEYEFTKPLVWDYIGVGSFAKWKRWERMILKKGSRLVIGEYQKENEEESIGIIRELMKGGVMVSPMVHPFDLSNLYNWSRTCYIPADLNGGGERAILEARSCGCSVEIEDDNPKLKELMEVTPIPSHIEYAKKLKDGILSVL